MSHLANIEIVCTKAGSKECQRLITNRKCPHINNAKILLTESTTSCIRTIKTVLSTHTDKEAMFLLISTTKVFTYQSTTSRKEVVKLFPGFLVL